MSQINVTSDTFTCHQEDDLAIITILEGAKILTTTIRGKEDLVVVMETIKEVQEIKGVVVLYSDKYLGDTEYRKFLQQSLEEKHYYGGSRYAVTYKSAILQFLEMINTYPKPIVGGMDGDIGPTSFSVNLAFDLRIATDNASFFHPNLQFGLPPSPPLSFYLVHSFGFPRATELILTRPSFTAQDALDLGLITKIVSRENLKRICVREVHRLTAIPGHALVESRRMLQPDMAEMRKYMDAAFEGALRCLNKMQR